jgi:hypothetical protein
MRRRVVALDLIDRDPHAFARQAAGDERDEASDAPDTLPVL